MLTFVAIPIIVVSYDIISDLIAIKYTDIMVMMLKVIFKRFKNMRGSTAKLELNFVYRRWNSSLKEPSYVLVYRNRGLNLVREFMH